MRRSIMNLRPKGDPDAAPYSPQRDLANIYTPMLREVFSGLDQVNWAAYFAGWLEATNVTEEDLGKGVQCFTEAHRLFIRDREVNSPHDAFEKAGFWDLPSPVRILIFERIGEVVMGGFFLALRDVSYSGQPSSVHTDFMDMLAAGRTLAGMLSKHRPRELDATATEINLAKVELEEFKRLYDQLRIENDALRRLRHAAEKERDECKARASLAWVSHAWITGLSDSVIGRIKPCWHLLWYGKLPGD